MTAQSSSPKNAKSFEESLWDTATKLRGSVESSEYKHVVLSLIFLKFVSDKFEERRAELIAEGKEKYTDMVEFYTMQNVFYLPETSRWSYIQQHAKQGDIAIKYDFDYPEDKLLELAKKVKTEVDDKAKYTDWSQREDIKAELKVSLIILLANNDYPPVDRDEVYKEIFEQAQNFKKHRAA